MDKKPKVEDTSDGSVNITWNKPNSNGGLNETIMYDVECYFCEENLCNKLCIGKIYSPSQYNLTGTSVVISDLYNGLYIVRVYPKNSLNELVRKEKWNFTTTKQFAIHLAGKTYFSGEKDILAIYNPEGEARWIYIIYIANKLRVRCLTYL